MEAQELFHSFIEKYTESFEGQVVKDLKLNFEKLTTASELDTEELSLLIISIGKMLEFVDLKTAGIDLAKGINIPDTHINEALQIPAGWGCWSYR